MVFSIPRYFQKFLEERVSCPDGNPGRDARTNWFSDCYEIYERDENGGYIGPNDHENRKHVGGSRSTWTFLWNEAIGTRNEKLHFQMTSALETMQGSFMSRYLERSLWYKTINSVDAQRVKNSGFI